MPDHVDGGLAVVVPCGHLAPRPTGSSGTVICAACGRGWRLVADHGGRSWAATEIVTRPA